MAVSNINWPAFLVAAFLGMSIEFWNMKNPNPYRKAVGYWKVIVVAAAIGMMPQIYFLLIDKNILSEMMALPVVFGFGALTGWGAARFSDVAAELMYLLITKVAIGIDRWQRNRSGTEETREEITKKQS